MREGDFTLSADGGGSKLAAVMFDDAFHFRAAGYGGPVNGGCAISLSVLGAFRRDRSRLSVGPMDRKPGRGRR